MKQSKNTFLYIDLLEIQKEKGKEKKMSLSKMYERSEKKERKK